MTDEEIWPEARWEPTKVYQKMCTHANYQTCDEHWVVREARNGFRPGEDKPFVTSVIQEILAKPCTPPASSKQT